MAKENKIEFILDGKIVNLSFGKDSGLSPTTTLLKYLRSLPSHKGTKEGCAEGDCGACTVVFAEIIDGKIKYKAINSCLVLLPMVHGKHIITIEYLENSNELHPIQQAIVDNNASQCGFCTPGIAMSLVPLYKSEIKVDEIAIRDSLSGNLCRCTGYSSILSAGKQAVINIKDDKMSENEIEIFNLLSDINRKVLISIVNEDVKYFVPFDLNEAISLKENFKESVFLSGASEIGLKVSKKKNYSTSFIDISQITELKQIVVNDDWVFIGSSSSLNRIKDELKLDFEALHNILDNFGSNQIRNLASIGGNVASASPIGDTIPVLMAYNAVIVLQSQNDEREIMLEDFIVGYRKTVIHSDEIITGIKLKKSKGSTIIKSYKISRRKDLDISTVSVSFRLELAGEIVKDIAIYFGGMAEKVVRAKKTEDFLKNRAWDIDNVYAGMDILKNEFNPLSDARAEKEGRNLFASNLLLKFYNDTL